MSEEILKVLEKLKNKSNYQRDCNDESYFIELFANEIYILCKFMEDLPQKIEQLEKENKRLNNIINECANDILKELKENSHLSYGVALSIRQKLIDYKELKEGKNE